MALSGSFSTSLTTANGQLDDRFPRNLVVSWSAIQNVANNTSTIHWTLKVGTCSNTNNYTSVNKVKLTINGTVVYSDQSTGTMRYPNTVLGSGKITVTHNSDGSKSIPVYAEAGFYEWTPNSSYSGTITLDTIPRASTMSFPEFTMGTSGIINIHSASSSFTHTLTYGFGNVRGTIAEKTTITSIAWTPPTNEFSTQIPTSVIGKGGFYLDTYSGNTLIGSAYYDFYCNIPNDAYPTIGEIRADVEPINGNYVLVKGKNRLILTAENCNAGIGSTIRSYKFSGPAMNVTTSWNYAWADVISYAGTLTYTITVTDARGRSASTTHNVTCHDYYAPGFNGFRAYRADANGNPDNNGTYIKIGYGLYYAPVNGTNYASAKAHYSDGANTYSTDIDGGSALINVWENAKTYNVYLTGVDAYGGTAASWNINVFGSTRILNITADGTGFAIGKMAEHSNLLESRWPLQVDDKITTLKPAETLNDMSYRGANFVASPEHDFVEHWNNQGNLATTFYTNTGMINGQPSQYGFLFNITNGAGNTEAHQLWMEQIGSLYHRGGNGGGFQSWHKILDEANCPDYVIEQAVAGEFRYRKWNKGMVEVWYNKELGRLDLTEQMAEGVYSNSTYKGVTVNIPVGLFNAPPFATANVGSNGYTLCQISDTSATAVTYRIWSSHSSHPNNCRISIRMMGTWK